MPKSVGNTVRSALASLGHGKNAGNRVHPTRLVPKGNVAHESVTYKVWEGGKWVTKRRQGPTHHGKNIVEKRIDRKKIGPTAAISKKDIQESFANNRERLKEFMKKAKKGKKK